LGKHELGKHSKKRKEIMLGRAKHHLMNGQIVASNSPQLHIVKNVSQSRKGNFFPSGGPGEGILRCGRLVKR